MKLLARVLVSVMLSRCTPPMSWPTLCIASRPGKMRAALTIMVLAWMMSSGQSLAQGVPQPFPDRIPKRLHFLVGGVWGQEAGFDLKEGVVTFHAKGVDNSTRQKTTHPSREAWRKFVRTINAARVYAWLPEYVDHNVVDGGEWTAELMIGDNEVLSHGSNAYPRDDALYMPTSEWNKSQTFKTFWTAFCELVGEDPKNYPL